MRVALAIAGAAIISPVQAQIAAVPQWPPAANYGYGNVYQPILSPRRPRRMLTGTG
jgi:hypothetical protein